MPEEKYWTVPHTDDTLTQLSKAFLTDRVVVSPSLRGYGPKLSAERISQVLTALDQFLTLNGYSDSTRDRYGQQVNRFLKRVKRDPIEVSAEGLRSYLLEQLDEELSPSYVRQARAALVILYEHVLDQPDKLADLPSCRGEKQLPLVLSKEEVLALLEAAPDLKAKALLTLIYSAGLRIGERFS